MPVENSAGSHVSRRRRTRLRHAGSLLLAFPLIGASIQGSVIDAVSGAPVPRAHVTLLGEVNGRPVRYGATSGADGGFSFAGIAAGGYEGLAERPGYVDQSGTSEGRIQVRLEGADDSKTGVAINLTPTGSITGRVTDADGEPVEGVSVSAESGVASGVGTTDERGRFRIGGLRPGKFMVRAVHGDFASQDKPETRTDGTVEVHDADTCYPGVAAARQAGKVDVRAGAETAGADIRLVRVPFVRVGGRVVGVPEGAHASLTILPQDRMRGEVRLQADGRFELWRLDPGKYALSGQWQAPGGEQMHTTEVAIELGNSNIDNIDLRVVSPSDIPGHLEFEDEEAKTLPMQQGVPPKVRQPEILLLNEASRSGEDSHIARDGTFQLKKVPGGKYRVRVSWGNTYIKSMLRGATAIEGANLDLSNGSGGADMSVLVAAAKSSISGTVRGSGAERAGLVVALVSQRDREDSRSCKIKPDGSYSFDRLPPGSYKIQPVAAKDLSNLLFYGTEADESQMEAVELGANDQVAKDLKVPTPR